MLDNAIQNYWKLMVEKLYHIVPRLSGQREGEDTHKKRGAGRPQSVSNDVHVNAVRALLEEHSC